LHELAFVFRLPLLGWLVVGLFVVLRLFVRGHLDWRAPLFLVREFLRILARLLFAAPLLPQLAKDRLERPLFLIRECLRSLGRLLFAGPLLPPLAKDQLGCCGHLLFVVLPLSFHLLPDVLLLCPAKENVWACFYHFLCALGFVFC
jgi:hypothetical protein